MYIVPTGQKGFPLIAHLSTHFIEVSKHYSTTIIILGYMVCWLTQSWGGGGEQLQITFYVRKPEDEGDDREWASIGNRWPPCRHEWIRMIIRREKGDGSRIGNGGCYSFFLMSLYQTHLTPRFIASATATMVMPSIMLLLILAISPEPAGPQYTHLDPMDSNSCSASFSAFSSPPTMNVSVPFSAPTTPANNISASVCNRLYIMYGVGHGKRDRNRWT